MPRAIHPESASKSKVRHTICRAITGRNVSTQPARGMTAGRRAGRIPLSAPLQGISIMNPRDYGLDAYWMPFTANRQFKSAPRLVVAAKDMHYVTEDGRRILDGTSGLWCVNAGHCRPKIVEAVKRQVETMDYSPAFQMGHRGAFRVAERLANLAPGDLDHVFYANSGSEAVDTALKI